LKQAIKNLLRTFDYKIKRYESPFIGVNAFQDMVKLSAEKARPIIFDMGANVGQYICDLKKRFRNPVIHAFEPSPKAFAILQKGFASSQNVILNKNAVGSTNGSHVLFENSHTELSSLLEPKSACGGSVVNRPKVDVVTIHSYCRESGVEHIHMPKVDT
jgi:FkbM family methyltransferase